MLTRLPVYELRIPLYLLLVWKSDKVLIATVALIMVACLSAQSGPLLPLTIKAIETDLAGKQTREFERIKDMKEVDACEKEMRAP